MIMRRLNMRIIKEVLRLKFECKLSNRDIAKSLKISRSSVSNYIEKFRSTNLNWPLTEAFEAQFFTIFSNNNQLIATKTNNHYGAPLDSDSKYPF